MYELKTNTAVRIAVGPLVDPTDCKTAEVALDVTALSVEIYRIANDGGAVTRAAFTPTASGGSNDMAHVTDDTAGMYDLELTAAQLNWLGNGRIAFYDVDGFLVHWIDILVVSAAHFNWKYGSTIPEVNVTQLGAAAQSLTDLKDFADTGYDPSTHKVQGVVLSDTCTTNSDMRGTNNAATAAKLLAYLQLLARKDAAIAADNAVELAELNADGGSGTGAFANTTDAGEAIRDRGDAAWDAAEAPTPEEIDTQLSGTHGAGSWLTSEDAGSGANTISISVVDGDGVALESARVRLTKGANRPLATTVADGSASIAVDNGTWTLAATLAGYQYAAATLDGEAVADRQVIVTGDHTLAIVLEAVTITPSDLGFVTGYLYCYSAGAPSVGASVSLQVYHPDADATGIADNSTVRTEVSDANGLVEFPGLIPGSAYKLRRGTVAAWEQIVVPIDAEDPYELSSIAGRP